jgi:hypothetical protein
LRTNAGHMLDLSSEFSAGFKIEGLSKSLPVVAESIYPAPSSDVEYTLIVKDNPKFNIRVPAGAWPAGDPRPVKLSVVEVKNNPQLKKETERMGGATFIGAGIYFQPTGIQFSKPVEIAIPYNSSMDLGSKELNVYRYNSTTKAFEKVVLSNRGIDRVSSIIYAETSSFSLYAPLAMPRVVPNVSPAPPLPPPPIVKPTPVAPPQDSTRIPLPVIIGASVGGAVFLLLVAVLYWRWSKPTGATKPVREPVRPETHGISTSQAREKREVTKPDVAKTAELPTPHQEIRSSLAPQERQDEIGLDPRIEPAIPPPTAFSTREIRALIPVRDEVAPIVRDESPSRALRSTPPVTPIAPNRSADDSAQV